MNLYVTCYKFMERPFNLSCSPFIKPFLSHNNLRSRTPNPAAACVIKPGSTDSLVRPSRLELLDLSGPLTAAACSL